MTTPNIDLLLSDITFRRGYAAQSLEVTVRDVLVDDTRFATLSTGALINEVRALREERDALRTQLAAARVCKWREDDPDFGTWRTGCGHLWSFNAGGPEENDAKFCQYCGGELTAALTQEDA
jgi:hypothetical protein